MLTHFVTLLKRVRKGNKLAQVFEQIFIFLHVLMSDIGTTWRQHTFVKTYVKTCASFWSVFLQFNIIFSKRMESLSLIICMLIHFNAKQSLKTLLLGLLNNIYQRIIPTILARHQIFTTRKNEIARVTQQVIIMFYVWITLIYLKTNKSNVSCKAALRLYTCMHDCLFLLHGGV